jgi:hypothetical protein
VKRSAVIGQLCLPLYDVEYCNTVDVCDSITDGAVHLSIKRVRLLTLSHIRVRHAAAPLLALFASPRLGWAFYSRKTARQSLSAPLILILTYERTHCPPPRPEPTLLSNTYGAAFHAIVGLVVALPAVPGQSSGVRLKRYNLVRIFVQYMYFLIRPCITKW